MSTSALIPVEEYLRTSYRPDCEYVDGEVQERNLGEYEHATIQKSLILWFGNREREWNIRVLPEQRLQTTASNFRVPDVMVLRGDQPIQKRVTIAPLLLVEILSPEDTLRKMHVRVNEYAAMGVEHIWLLDPETRTAYRCTPAAIEVATELSIQGTPIYLPLPGIFAALD
jgi:Uma2 family endonuclease